MSSCYNVFTIMLINVSVIKSEDMSIELNHGDIKTVGINRVDNGSQPYLILRYICLAL